MVLSPDQYKDNLGNRLFVGDFVAYAVCRYKSGSLNIGLITELTSYEGYEWEGQNRVKVNMPNVRVRLYEPGKQWDPATKQYTAEMMRIRNAMPHTMSEIVKVDSVPAHIADFLRSNDTVRNITGSTLKMGDIDDAVIEI